jgi:hypothetical protein
VIDSIFLADILLQFFIMVRTPTLAHTHPRESMGAHARAPSHTHTLAWLLPYARPRL